MIGFSCTLCLIPKSSSIVTPSVSAIIGRSIIDGWLDVMNKKNTFSGVISDDGQLTLSGEIRTLISTVHYTATGTVSGRKILLNIKTDSGAHYPVSGEEFNIDDKVL